MEIENIGKRSFLSVLNNPFIKKRITRISVHYQKLTFGNKWVAYGTIEFKNGDTTGKQDFEDSTWDGVVIKMNAFIKELEENEQI